MTAGKYNSLDEEFKKYVAGEKLYGDGFYGDFIRSWYNDAETAGFEPYIGVDTMHFSQLYNYYSFPSFNKRFTTIAVL